MYVEEILKRAALLDLDGETTIFDKESNSYYRLMLYRSFEARLRQADKDVREYYNTIKNEILSFHDNGVQLSPRFSYKHETFKDNRNPGFVLSIRGKTLCINFAVPPSYFEGRNYRIEDVSNLVMFADTPSMMRVKSPRDCEKAIEIIDEVLYDLGYEKGLSLEMDYISSFNYLDTQSLIDKGLMRVDLAQIDGPNGDFITFESTRQIIKVPHIDFKRKEHEIVSDNRFSIEYHRSFLSKLIKSDMDTKYFYSVLKNELCSYKRIKSHYYWGDEAFRAWSKVQAKLAFNGKTLCLYLNLNPKDFKDTKYKVEDQGERKKFAAVPLLYRIRNKKKCKYAIELIEMAMNKTKLRKNKKFKKVDYSEQLLEQTDEQLLKEGLIRKVATRH